MPEITARPYKYKEGDLVLANGERFGVVLEHQAGWVYKIRSGSEQLFYVESQLERAEEPVQPLGNAVVEAVKPGRGASGSSSGF